jgi:hypothetical protein
MVINTSQSEKMRKKTLPLIFTTIFIISLFITSSPNGSYAATTDPANLKIYLGPTSVLADNKTYTCIFVELQDSSQKPARALQDTTITLSSSLTNIGTVDPSITIPKGQTFASATFTSTFSPGSTSITASASGYTTVQSTITTIGPIPTSVAVYGFPSTLPADNQSYEAIIVQLQDSSGTPAKAPKGGVFVSLSCSNTSIGTVSPDVTIPEGKTYAYAFFNTTNQAQVEGKAKTVVVTTVAQGYSSQQMTMTVTPIVTTPTQLKIFTGPNKFPADQNSYRQIAIQLQNASGYVATSANDVSVSLGSSDPTIGEVDSLITIPQSQTYTVATLNTTYKTGSTTLTAVATDLLRSQQAVSTVGFTPSKLAVYCAPSVLASDNGTYQTIQVQLQDSQGRPAKDPQADVNLNLFSSQPTVATVSSTLTIPFGQTQATGTIAVSNAPGSTSITAQASSYTTGQGTLTTYIIDFLPIQVTATPDSTTLTNGQKTNITVTLSADNNLVTGATLKFSSDNGGSFTTCTDQGNGSYKTIFTAPSFTKSTTCTLTASASKTGYITSQATVQITVQPATSPTPTPTADDNSSSLQNTTTSSLGIIQMLIEDSDSNPLINATVYSTSQPAGAAALSDTTNSTGYVTFTNLTTGMYNFCLCKDGYATTNIPFNFTGESKSRTYTLNSDIISKPSNSDTFLIIVAVVVVVVVVVIALGVIVVKRRHADGPLDPANIKLHSGLSNF